MDEKGSDFVKRATEISEILYAFSSDLLQKDDLEKFYYDGTMKSRVGDANKSPIEVIYKSCTRTSKSAYLLLGHIGCGKSTELNELKKKLKKEDYLVEDINFKKEIDMVSPTVWDLLLLITEKLLRIADEINCDIDDYTLNSLLGCFTEREETREFVEEAGFSLDGGVKVGSSWLKTFIELFVNLSAEVKVGDTTRTVIREVVKRRASTWIKYVNQIADVIADRNSGKRPVLIVEDVDKMDPERAKDLFIDNARTLSDMSFHIIYTFPISLSYDPVFKSIQGYYSDIILPMIKIKNPDNSVYEDGIEAIRTIIEKRSSLGLFSEGVTDLLIKKTGGSLRDLFKAIIRAGDRAENRGNSSIDLDDAKWALSDLRNSLTKMIQKDDYPLLNSLLEPKNRTQIDKTEHLLKMMQAQVVLEYHNGKRWQDVHPLVTDFLGEIEIDESSN